MSISKIKLADNTVYEIIPHKLTDSTYTVTLPTLTADSTFALSSDLSSYLPLTGGTLTGDLSFSYGKGINNAYSISCYELSAQELSSPLIKNVSALIFGNTNYQFKLPYSGSSILQLACNSTSNNVLSVKHNDDDTAHTIEFATTTSLSDGTNSVTIAEIQSKLSAGTNIEITNNTVSTTDNVLTDTDILYLDCGSATSNTSDSPDITVLLTREY